MLATRASVQSACRFDCLWIKITDHLRGSTCEVRGNPRHGSWLGRARQGRVWRGWARKMEIFSKVFILFFLLVCIFLCGRGQTIVSVLATNEWNRNPVDFLIIGFEKNVDEVRRQRRIRFLEKQRTVSCNNPDAFVVH